MTKNFFALLIMTTLYSTPAFALRAFYTLGPDGAGTLTPYLSDYIVDYSLSQNTAQTIAWPAGATHAILSATDIFLVGAAGHTAQIPDGNITDGTGSILNLGQVQKGSESSFSVITPNSNVVLSVAFYY